MLSDNLITNFEVVRDRVMSGFSHGLCRALLLAVLLWGGDVLCDVIAVVEETQERRGHMRGQEVEREGGMFLNKRYTHMAQSKLT